MKTYFFAKNILIISSLTGLLWLSGCQMVNVKQQKMVTTISNERDSILTRKRLSEASLNILSITALDEKSCIEKPQPCLQKIQSIAEIPDEQMLSTGSELYLAHALMLKDSDACQTHSISQHFKDEQEKQLLQQQYQQCTADYLEALNQSIRYSYAYLFATKRPPQQRLFDNRQVQVRDFYNQAISQLMSGYNQQRLPQDFSKPFSIGKTTYQLNLQQFPSLNINDIEQLQPTYNLTFSGLNSISRRDGFGAEFTVQRKQNHQQFSKYQSNAFLNIQHLSDHPNIHPARFLAATMIIEPNATQSINDILNSRQLTMRLLDPNRLTQANIQQQNFPLAANFSAPYGLWLANNNLGASAYWTLIDRERDLVMPHLFLLEPYNPNKRIIIMIHGLASSPEAWVAMTNDIMGDPVLREHYQVWQVFYSTNMPILESRYQIHALLKQALTAVEKQYPQQPPRHTVILGHSMGGIISRLLLTNDNLIPPLQQYIKENHSFNIKPLTRQSHLQQRLKMTALTPQVDRAIFVSAPFRGTDYADRWFTLLARHIIKLPQSFLNASIDLVQNSLGDNPNAKALSDQLGRALVQNGPSDLSRTSVFMHITHNIHITPQVKYHVIMGNNTASNDPKIMNDGIVPYLSSHLDGAQSEKIIPGGHSIQFSPEAVLEVRRILREQLHSQ